MKMRTFVSALVLMLLVFLSGASFATSQTDQNGHCLLAQDDGQTVFDASGIASELFTATADHQSQKALCNPPGYFRWGNYLPPTPRSLGHQYVRQNRRNWNLWQGLRIQDSPPLVLRA